MYNRYIPQSDGTYCRTSIPEHPPEPRRSFAPPTKPTDPPPLPCQNCSNLPHPRRPAPPRPPKREPPQGIGSFLKQLLPKNFDTEDLLIVLLLLLMAGDSQEDQNSALLTLVLYLFL